MPQPRRLTASRLDRLAADLMPRERTLLATLGVIHVATTSQLARVVFPAAPSADRLARRHLERLRTTGLVRRFIDRSRDRQVGATGYVHALTAAGGRLTGIGRSTAHRQRRAWRPEGSFLAHRLAVTELYVRLIEQQARGGPTVHQFAAEPECWRSWAGPAGTALALRPDALVRLAIEGQENSWFVEMDLGTEPSTTIAAKCQAYALYETSGLEVQRHGVFPGVIFVVPDAARAGLVGRVIARQPASTRSLFAVVTDDQVLAALSEVAAA